MEFGRLNHDDFNPEVPPLSVASPGQRTEGGPYPDLFVGAPKWRQASWKPWYQDMPKGESELRRYSRLMNTVELNSTYYAVPQPEQIIKWRREVEDRHFRFCPKVPRAISQAPGPAKAGMLLNFVERVGLFGRHLGPCFLQLPEHLSFEKWEPLKKLLAYWPSEISLQVEMRHPSWFESYSHIDLWAGAFTEMKIGTVINDTPGRRDVLHQQVPTGRLLVRIVGSNSESLDRQRLIHWHKRLRNQLKGEAHLILHFQDEKSIPKILSECIAQESKAQCSMLEHPVLNYTGGPHGSLFH